MARNFAHSVTDYKIHSRTDKKFNLITFVEIFSLKKYIQSLCTYKESGLKK